MTRRLMLSLIRLSYSNWAYVLVILGLTISCDNNKETKYDLFEVHEREMILKHKVSKITEIEIGLDTAGNSRWKRVRNTKLYDQGGLLVISISPGYITKPWADSSPEGMTLAEMDYYALMSRTNIPNGQIDTTHFSYDEHGNLTSLKNEYHTTYEYDGYNNPIEKCISSDYTETPKPCAILVNTNMMKREELDPELTAQAL